MQYSKISIAVLNTYKRDTSIKRIAQGDIQEDFRYNDYVTGTILQAYSIVFEEEFEVNRPFLYTIIKTSSNQGTGVREVIPLFAGHIVNPENWVLHIENIVISLNERGMETKRKQKRRDYQIIHTYYFFYVT